MEKLGLGQIITGHQERDAVHIAIAPVIANCRIKPGEHLAFIKNSTEIVTNTDKDNAFIGIADPFLKKIIKTGEKFWIYLYPNTITSLNHMWTHPAFVDTNTKSALSEDDIEKAKSIQWIEDLANSVDITYNRLMEGAKEYAYCNRRDEWPDYIVGGAEMEGVSVPDEFWDHYRVVTGDDVEDEHRGSFFSCSC